MPTIPAFSEIPDQKTFDPVPSGNYRLKLVDYREKDVQSGKNKGEDLIALQFEIVDSEVDEYNGRRVFENITWIEDSMPRVKGMLRSMGMEQPEDDEVSFEWDDLLGNEVYAKVRIVPKQKDKKTGVEYEAKNAISKYLFEDEEEDDS
jgi:hypothetical protein